MKTRARDWVSLGAALGPTVLGLGASVTLLVDYLKPAPVFCGLDSGCDVVKQTSYASLAFVPTPVLGVVAFAALGALTLARGNRVRLLQLVGAVLAALFAAFFIFVQSQLGAFCKYCMIADCSALVLLGVSIVRFAKRWDPAPACSRAGVGVLALS